jgi:3-oxoacyl-[acyl-carrier protein] reductase
VALTLARQGADVAVNYRRDEADAARVVATIEGMGRRAAALGADIGDAELVADLARRAEAALGAIDILVHSAGGPWKPQDITEIAPEHLRRILALEVESTYALLRAVLPGMRARLWGRIVLVGGHLADDWRFGPPEAPLDYPLGKAARHWIVRTLGPREHAHGITVNAVAPGPVPHVTFEEAVAALDRRAAPGGGNTPQDIAEVVAFLCSESAARVTGAVVPLPGASAV